jgi:hypothetical protein
MWFAGLVMRVLGGIYTYVSWRVTKFSHFNLSHLNYVIRSSREGAETTFVGKNPRNS